MPMRRDDRLHIRRWNYTELAEVIRRDRRAGIAVDARVHHDPLGFAKMRDNTFTKARAEQGNLHFLIARRDSQVIPSQLYF